MAVRYAVASTNWSLPSTWDGGGSIPSSTDDVYANGFNVNINQTITVNSLKKIAGSGIVAGGTFVVTTASTVNITAGIAAADNVTNTTYLLGVNAGSAAVTINAAIVGGNGSGRIAVQAISGYTGTLSINGAVSSGDVTGVSNAYAVLVAAACVVNVVGNVTVSSTAFSPAIACTAGAVISVTGNITAGGSGGHGLVNTGTNASITVTGIVTGGSTNGVNGVNNSGTGSQVTIVGTVKGGPNASLVYGILATAGSLRLDALLQFGALGSAPVHCQNVVPLFKRTGAYLGIEAPSDDNWPAATGATITIERYTTGNPAPANVRLGTTYGPGSTSTGTLAVPPAASVASGVPVDNTTGTAALKLSDVLAGTGAQIAAAS